MRKGVGDWEAVSAEQMPGPNRDKPPDEPRQISMPCHSCSAGKRVSSLSQTHMYIHTHSDGDCALLFCFQFFQPPLRKVYSALESHLADGRSVQEKAIITQGKYCCRPDLCLKTLPLSVFMIPGEIPPPLRNYYQTHQSP